jgi:Tetratricopeptide repeat
VTSPDDAGAPLPPDAILAVDPEALLRALPGLPDELNGILRLAGGRTVAEAVRESGLAPGEAAGALRRLLATGALRLVDPAARGSAPRNPGGATPEPEGAAWFAQPVDSDRADPAAEGAVPAGLLAASGAGALAAPVEPRATAESPDPAPVPQEPTAVPPLPGSARTWLYAAALLVVVAAVVAGAVARRGPSATAGAAVAPPGGDGTSPPPALAPTEPRPAVLVAEALSRARERLGAGDLESAAAACRQAIGVDPSAGGAWVLLGEVHLASGDRARARSAFERSLAVDPAGPGAAAARVALERLRP